MNKLRKNYCLANPQHVQELLEVVENGDLSDIGEIEGDSDSGEELIDESAEDAPFRLGSDEITPAQAEEPEDDLNHEEDQEEALDSEEEEEIAPQDKRHKKNRITVVWKRQSFTSPTIPLPPPIPVSNAEPLSPIEYFSRYINDDLFEQMAFFTNLYAAQNGRNMRAADKHEMQILFALHIAIGCLRKFPRLRMYWEKVLGIGLFLENMSRDRFFQLRSCLHLVNNLERPATCQDKLYKVRPIIEAVRKRCLELELEDEFCVDEQIIPFTGKLSVKQYIKGKPCPWGIKVFMLCGKSGKCYDFHFYQGKSTGLNENNLKNYGQGAAVVLHFSERIAHRNSKLFYDNYFSSYSLLNMLRENEIYAAGTIRINRFYKPPVMSDSEMKKKDRGYSDEVVNSDNTVVVVKWLDNKTVCLASNYVGIGVEDKVKRWDKSQSAYVEINRPAIIRDYNHAMGGVDLFDQLISYYRIFIRSRKWTLRVIMHMVDFALANSWIEYKKDCEEKGIPQKKVMDLLAFRMRVVHCLIYMGKPVSSNRSKRGRPTSSPSSSSPTSIRKHYSKEQRPLHEVQLDGTDHLPVFDENKEATRCKKLGCKGRSHIYCCKCKVHLCFVRERQYFTSFHRTEQ